MAKIGWVTWDSEGDEYPNFHTEEPGRWYHRIMQIVYFEVAPKID